MEKYACSFYAIEMWFLLFCIRAVMCIVNSMTNKINYDFKLSYVIYLQASVQVTLRKLFDVNNQTLFQPTKNVCLPNHILVQITKILLDQPNSFC